MNEKETINKAVDHIQYVLTYGLKNDVTEKEIEQCEKLMRTFLTTYNVQIANNKGDLE